MTRIIIILMVLLFVALACSDVVLYNTIDDIPIACEIAGELVSYDNEQCRELVDKGRYEKRHVSPQLVYNESCRCLLSIDPAAITVTERNDDEETE